MNVLLEVATRLRGADAGEIFHWGLEKFRDVEFYLLAQARIF
jgi:hypothetical protein